MKRIHMPLVGWRYWAGITLASIFGTNMGDLYAHELHLGIALGVAVLAVLAGAVFLVERANDGATEIFYWSVIIIIRTGATNIADYLAFRAHVPKLPLTIGLALMIAVFAGLSARRSAGRAAALPPGELPATGPSYWIAMLGAGVFGTVLGDIISHAIGEGPASIGLAALLGLVLVAGHGIPTRVVAAYWLTVATARTAGTAIGDWLAENKTLEIGLPLSTLLTGLAFVALLVFWRSARRPAAAIRT